MKNYLFLFLCLLVCSSYAQPVLEIFMDANRKFGFKNASGKVVIPANYEDAGKFREGDCAVKQKGKWGFITKTEKN
jgi:hypothetical protein